MREIHTLIVAAVVAWGAGGNGQLGFGSLADALIPQQVEALFGVDVVTIAAGNSHSAAISRN